MIGSTRNIKVYAYDGAGHCTYAKRLARGSFASLWRDGDSPSLSLSISELASAQRAREALRRENAMLLRRIEELTKKLAEDNNQDTQAQLQLELAVLNERLKNPNRDLYGSRSERSHKPEPKEKSEQTKRRPRRKSGRNDQSGLKRIIQEHLFDEADLTCPTCGHRMVIKRRPLVTRKGQSKRGPTS
ncbi:MAG: hypothetical protein EA397_03715 [Deltaproteobacteria bacterium]|nr:MAG: hypothetical protein EA397_03715 [Deltaproteobacteria bacterium]